MGFDAEGICGVDENAGMLRCNDGLDDSGKIVDIRQGFDTQNDIIISVFSGGGIFGVADDW